MDLGPKIRKWREDAKVTQQGLATAADVSLRTVQNWEDGGAVKLGDYIRIVKTLNVPRGEAAAAIEMVEPRTVERIADGGQ